MKLTIGDRIWIACALLHREQPGRISFDRAEIVGKLGEVGLAPPNADSLRTHLSRHSIAGKKPDPDTLRVRSREEDGTLRLYRAGDPVHPGRESGKTNPDPEALPEAYRGLLDWYRLEYCAGLTPAAGDPILALRGVGKQVWRELGGGDEFVRGLRANWLGPEREGLPESPKETVLAGGKR
ncbi:MAG: hypothetical protein HY822_10155 [Acidobacteria bacterium]|nr:hypothetical protein [Acidobacteriota bacterium]